jgi:hypothetical protein
MIDKKIVFLLGCFVFIVFSMQFILAASGAPTALNFSNNVTANYDEGIFQVNWTAGGGDGAGNYTVYVFNSTHMNVSAQNNSITGYSFSTTAESNYTFIIQVANATNFKTNSTSNISMYVDRTVPLVNWTNSGYTNATVKKNTDKLTLNISVGDASSGLINSRCIFNINGTNESVVVTNGWCNTTQLNLTGLADGNSSINIWANDTVNNVGVNLSSYVVWIDTTAPPAPTFSCTPTSVYATETITCSCSGTDASSGVNSTTYTANPSTADSGTFSTSCTIIDKAGNSISSSFSYHVGGVRDTSSSTLSVSTWTNTYTITDDQFNEGFTRELSAKNRIRLNVNEETHYVGIISLTSTTAVVNVSSISQQKTMSIGEEWKVEVTDDTSYDILIKLNNIISNKANVTLSYISELIGDIPEEDLNQDNLVNDTNGDVPGDQNKKDSSNWWIFVVVGLVILGVIFFFLKNKKIFKRDY